MNKKFKIASTICVQENDRISRFYLCTTMMNWLQNLDAKCFIYRGESETHGKPKKKHLKIDELLSWLSLNTWECYREYFYGNPLLLHWLHLLCDLVNKDMEVNIFTGISLCLFYIFNGRKALIVIFLWYICSPLQITPLVSQNKC